MSFFAVCDCSEVFLTFVRSHRTINVLRLEYILCFVRRSRLMPFAMDAFVIFFFFAFYAQNRPFVFVKKGGWIVSSRMENDYPMWHMTKSLRRFFISIRCSGLKLLNDISRVILDEDQTRTRTDKYVLATFSVRLTHIPSISSRFRHEFQIRSSTKISFRHSGQSTRHDVRSFLCHTSSRS